jgi:hypothetical protein
MLGTGAAIVVAPAGQLSTALVAQDREMLSRLK